MAMNERECMLYKQSQLEMCFVIRLAQVTARWVIPVAQGVIEEAKRKRITFNPRRK